MGMVGKEMATRYCMGVVLSNQRCSNVHHLLALEIGFSDKGILVRILSAFKFQV
jgi:hypothetical protein